MPIIKIDQDKKAAIDRRIAVAAADEWFAAQVASGFTTEYGWRLGLDENDVTLLTGAFVLAKEASAMGLPLPAIVDADGVPHSLSLADMTALMLAYGAHRAALSEEYAAMAATI